MVGRCEGRAGAWSTDCMCGNGTQCGVCMRACAGCGGDASPHSPEPRRCAAREQGLEGSLVLAGM